MIFGFEKYDTKIVFLLKKMKSHFLGRVRAVSWDVQHRSVVVVMDRMTAKVCQMSYVHL